MPQSPELAGGAGFKFEDEVSGAYLASLLTRTAAPGTGDRVVTRVALQQRDFGEPLDDLIVDSIGLDGGEARLSVQVKSSLTISAATSNSDFREIVRDALATLRKTDFREGADRFGVVTGYVATQKAKTLNQLIDFARNSVEAVHFFDRFSSRGHASQEARILLTDLRALADAYSPAPISDGELHRLISHFALIEFDFQSSASRARSDGVARAAQALTDEAAGQASLLWSRLCHMGGLAAKAAGVFDRPRLLREVKAVAPLQGLGALRPDLLRLSELSQAWVSDIEKDVSGVTVPRAALRKALIEKMAAGRLVQITGLPGSGKSVLLRMEIEDALAQGPVLFLKHDRLSGTSWTSFATANGLTAASLDDVMAEVGSVGTPTLFIDGVDRIEKEHRGVVLDVVRAVATVEGLKDWRIVMTLRDTGIGPLRNWLGSALSALGVQTLEAPELDDSEAAALASDIPSLQPVLTSKGAVREIARRPFFAKILQQASMAGGDATVLHSEVDLIRNWWLNGGYAADGKDALLRQRAIVDLGRRRARALSKPIAIAGLQTSTVEQIPDLVSDGILKFVVPGVSLRFAHDIFFEWAFFQTLVDCADDWPDELVEAGQPPAFARVVELFSQSLFPSEKWAITLGNLSTQQIRSQWIRAWLLGPIGSTVFPNEAKAYEDVVFVNEGAWLYKALVWFQAERTTPNPVVIGGDLPPETRIRMADSLGWPSDVESWARLIWFLVERIDRVPIRLQPQVMAVFTVWQNMFADMKNPVSDVLLTVVGRWLSNLGDGPDDSISRWRRRQDGSSRRTAYVTLILRAARAYPDHATAYLSTLVASEDIDEPEFEEVVAFSPILAETHGSLLVEVTLKHLKEELPADQKEREFRENERAARRRQAAMAIPEAERTVDQQRVADGLGMSFGGRSFSYHDWKRLALDRDLKTFFPASPLRQPYPALFQHAPDEAIRLVTDLSNHAITAWRQLHTLDYETPGTPIPIVLDFPWGRQTFWGGEREYLWSRGLQGPKALGSGYLALEDWAVDQLSKGADLDTLIRRIIDGNTCVAVLGVAVALALQSGTLSAASAVLVQSQRLWAADQARFHKDLVESRAALIGFKADRDRAHVEAIERALARPIRRMELRNLGQRFVIGGGPLSDAVRAVIEAFPTTLPFFYEEHRTNNEAVAYHTERAVKFAEVADLKTYTIQPTDNPGEVAVFHTPPSLDSDEAVVARAAAARTLLESSLWSWAAGAFETGTLGERFTLTPAAVAARTIDAPGLFQDVGELDELVGMRRGAVAAVAALLLKHRHDTVEDDLVWARDVTLRALQTPERQDALWTAGMIVPWHQTIFACRAIASDLRAGTGDDALAEALLGLIAHPLQAVALSAFAEAVALIDVRPPLGWAALGLAFDLCDIKPRRGRNGYNDPLHTPADLRAAVTRATTAYRKGEFGTALPTPPAPWLEAAGPNRRRLEAMAEPEDESEDGVKWVMNPRSWDHHLAAELLRHIPVEAITRTDGREAFLLFVDQMLEWTIQKIAPSWSRDQRRQRPDTYDWDPELGRLLSRVAGVLEMDAVRDRVLTPITTLGGSDPYTLLAPFTDTFVCRYVFDAPVPPAHVMEVLDVCLDRLLKDSVFSRTSYRAGELHGFDQPALVKALLFVQIDEFAGGAARFVNRDWRDVGMVLGHVAKFVAAAGWSPFVMTQFLTLCERARDHYPPEHFADLTLAVLRLGDGEELPGWHGTTLAARIAGLVQIFSERAAPLSQDLALKLLQILDQLVDLGDRRSAALQQGEIFREIQLTS